MSLPLPLSPPVQPLDRRSALIPARSGRFDSGRPLVRLTATILTRNSEALLWEVLQALQWCHEIIVLDTGSSDRTLDIAASFPNVRLHELAEPLTNFGRARRQAVALASNDWILSIDSDELVSCELAAEIAGLELDYRCVYAAPFRNYYRGKCITTCGWAPDRHARLFNRLRTNFCLSAVHEKVQTDRVKVVNLTQPIDHYSYRSPADFLTKMATYAKLFAEQNAGRKSGGIIKALVRAGWAFGKSYLLQRGVMQGSEGLVISVYKAQTVFWKYLLLEQANRDLSA